MPNNTPMSYKKIFLFITFFLVMLTSFRIGWTVYHTPPAHPKATEGFIDLSNQTFNDKQVLSLNGEWEFYPHEFLNPNEAQMDASVHYLNVPENWKDTPYFDSKKPYGYGTYRLTVQLPNDNQELYGIRIKGASTAANVFINGKLVTQTGQPATSTKEHIGKVGPSTGTFYQDNHELEIIIHVSNYENYLFGGIDDSILIGTEKAINLYKDQSIILQIVVSAIYLLHFMYVFFIYFVGRRKYQKELFYYGLMLVFAALAILIDDEIVIHLPVSYEASLKILLFLFLSTLICLITFIKTIFQVKTRFFRFLTALFFLLIVCIITIPFEHFIYTLIAIITFYVSAILFLYFHTIQTIRKGHPESIFILIFITSYTSNVIWGAGISFGDIDIPFYPFDFLLYVIMIAFLLFKRLMRLVKLNDEQTKQLQKTDKMKDEFLTNTSHEIRNPLHGMINIAQKMLDQDDLSKENRENMMLLIDIGKRMNYTLNDLSMITQLKEGNVKLQQKNTNLNSVTYLVLDVLHFMKEGKPINLQSKIPANFPNVYVDENRLIQILFNLIHNAIKYTEQGSITIEANHTESMANIYVKDTGIGIPANKDRQQIFQSYERVDVSDNTTGIGIGLSVSKQLVELHGGTIDYQSTDEGTTFMFTIPLAHKDEKTFQKMEFPDTYSEAAATNETEGINKLLEHEEKAKILIVDDDPVNVKVISQVLNEQYDIKTAMNGKDALEKVKKDHFDLVISDVMMPYMSGYELTKKIREQFAISELPIILITARTLPEDVQIAFESGANDYLIKPVNALELKYRVKALTILKQSVKELLRFEAAWLQAQIHPHFLFNTLNTIASLAEVDSERMVSLLEAFGKYLQKSFAITNIESEIPITDELELTRSYVHIEKERFGSRIRVEFDIDNNINILIPPLSIQPLVENAIMHGILHKTEGGTVIVSVREIEDYVAVEIKDDGVGMTNAQVKELLRLHHSLDEGIGVKNTNRRLIQLYGSGLLIESELQKGTVVKFQIPKLN